MRALALAGVAALAACASSGGAPAPSGGAPRAAAGIETSTRTADQLALAAFRAAGGDKLGDVAELEFHFVVYDGDTKKSDVHHRWDLRGKRDRVTWKDREGVERDGVIDLETKKARGTVGGKPEADPGAKGNLAERLYGRWVNDTYWLILPLKVLDPGVHREHEGTREHGGKKYEILRLTFDHVGLTPGDTYWLFVEPATKRIERWEMVLEGDKPPPAGFSFEAHQKLGPLELALDHRSDDGKRRIAFEGVTAYGTVNAAHFSME